LSPVKYDTDILGPCTLTVSDELANILGRPENTAEQLLKISKISFAASLYQKAQAYNPQDGESVRLAWNQAHAAIRESGLTEDDIIALKTTPVITTELASTES
jgi:hypothetical protein